MTLSKTCMSYSYYLFLCTFVTVLCVCVFVCVCLFVCVCQCVVMSWPISIRVSLWWRRMSGTRLWDTVAMSTKWSEMHHGRSHRTSWKSTRCVFVYSHQSFLCVFMMHAGMSLFCVSVYLHVLFCFSRAVCRLCIDFYRMCRNCVEMGYILCRDCVEMGYILCVDCVEMGYRLCIDYV